jgi:hypothetical protein
MIGEVASSERGGSKSAWISDMFQTLSTAFPQVKALVWMDWNTDNPSLSWPLDSSRAASAAFANGVASAAYASNQFGNLEGGAIPALAAAPPPPNPITLTPVADTSTSRQTPNAQSAGSSAELYADTQGTNTAFLLFDLRPLAGKTISSVTLRLHTAGEAWAGSASTFDVRLVPATDWREEWMTFNNSVSVSNTILGSISAPRELNTWSSIRLSTDAVQRRAGGQVSLALNARTADVWIFHSRESGASTAPQLVIAYT